jgi:hypothetical protein
MVGKCANNWCPTVRRLDAGKLFRLDLELGSKAGRDDERKTEYIWLCPRCAQKMHPKVEVSGNTVRVRLLKNETIREVSSDASPDWVN